MYFPPLNRQFLGRLWDLLSPYFLHSGERLSAWLLIIISNGLIFLASSLGPLTAIQTGEMISALAKGDQPRFYHAVYTFAILSVTSAVAIGLGYYALFLLLVRWRRWLTQRVIDQYLEQRAYYRVSYKPDIDNPDLRIAEEIERLLFGVLILGSLVPIFSGRSFVAATYLWAFSHSLTITLVVLGILSTWLGYKVFFQALLKIQYSQQQREGNFRTGLVKVRESAESIAFYQGEEREKQKLGYLLGEVFSIVNRLLRWKDIYFALFTGANDIVIEFLAYVFAAPKILSGEVEIGTIYPVVSNSAVLYLLFSIFGQLVRGLSQTFNSLVRVDGLLKALEITKEVLEEVTIEEGDNLTITDLSLKTPDQARTLFEHLNITLNPGQSLLIIGKSGAGKSSLLRAIAGLWLSGSGLIIRPRLDNIFFLPQRPYMSLGTLRQQLFYPNIDHQEITLEELGQALAAVNLSDLPERVGGFEQELDWSKILSPGEQQRLSFARVLLSACKYIILDEATSALDPENEELMYKAIEGKTILSVGHRSSLIALHDQVLQIPPEELNNAE